MAFGYNLYYSERSSNRVLEWDPDSRESRIIAGGGVTESSLLQPYGLAIDANQNLLIADKEHDRICRLKNGQLEKIETYDPDQQRKSIFAGRQNNPLCPTGIFAEISGRLLVTYSVDNTIYRIHQDGRLEHVLGIPPNRYSVFKDFAEHVPEEKSSKTPLYMPTTLVATKGGVLYFIERGYQAVRIYKPGEGLATLFPYSLQRKFEKIYQAPQRTDTNSYYPPFPTSLAVGDDDNLLYLSDSLHRCIFEIDLTSKQMNRVTEIPKDIPRKSVGPATVSMGKDNTLWVMDTVDNFIYGFQKSPAGIWQKIEAKHRIPAGRYDGGTGMITGTIKQ